MCQIMMGDIQIALIETYLTVKDNKYIHKLYILDSYNEYADTLSFFVLYYANYTFVQRMQILNITAISDFLET